MNPEAKMLTLDVDLQVLTLEELAEARATVHRDAEDAEAADPHHQHSELRQLFAALEAAIAHAVSERGAEQHMIAEALAIDEETGEWLAGA